MTRRAGRKVSTRTQKSVSKNKKRKKATPPPRSKVALNGGKSEAPKVVVVVPFHANADGNSFWGHALAALGHQEPSVPPTPGTSVTFTLPAGYSGKTQRGELMVAPRDVQGTLDALKCADLVLALFTDSSYEEPAFDDLGYRLLTAAKLQGLPPVVGVRWGPSGTYAVENREAQKFTERYFTSEFGSNRRCFSVTGSESLIQVLRHLSDVKGEPLAFRRGRGYLFGSRVDYDAPSRTLGVAGYVRGEGMSPGAPVHVTGLGDFPLRRIVPLDDCECGREKMEALEASPEQMQAVAKLLADRVRPPEMPSAAPSVLGEGEMDGPPPDDEGEDEAEGSDDFDMGDDSDDEEELPLAADESRRPSFNPSGVEMQPREEDDLEFPDEVDTPTQTFAFQRFSKYRSLKSFATSSWNPKESLPLEYSQIYAFKDFAATVRHAKSESESRLRASGSAGHLVCLHIEGVSPEALRTWMVPNRPVVVSTLMPFELQVTVSHFSMTRHDTFSNEIPSKALVDIHCGFRRFEARPVFSENPSRGGVPSSASPKFKYTRRLPPLGAPPTAGTSCAAYTPACLPGIPALLFLRPPVGPPDDHVAAWGSSCAADTDRLLVKRILLTGRPFRVHKRKAVLRFMFFNPRDVRYFKSVELRTKSGARGHITSALGTHGHMKCIFNKPIDQSETVCMALYKRVFPKWRPAAWGGPPTFDG